jgi:hypothetical protein
MSKRLTEAELNSLLWEYSRLQKLDDKGKDNSEELDIIEDKLPKNLGFIRKEVSEFLESYGNYWSEQFPVYETFNFLEGRVMYTFHLFHNYNDENLINYWVTKERIKDETGN